MPDAMLRELLERVVAIAQDAAAEIEHLRPGLDATSGGVNRKADNSLVTKADIAASRLIRERLAELTPQLPVLCEEGDIPEFTQRSGWQRYWLIDPLDGTRSFVEGDDSYTVNIALIEGHRPVIGVVAVPACGDCYFAMAGLGAFLQRSGDTVEIVSRRAQHQLADAGRLRLVTGFRGASAVQTLMQNLAARGVPCEHSQLGSSLKLCLLASGGADFYPCLVRTHEWDTAAGQCVLEQAGGAVLDEHFKSLGYNQKAELANPNFYAIADASFDWPRKLEA